jgi:hypothetical protein
LPFEHRELLIQGRRSGMVVLSTTGALLLLLLLLPRLLLLLLLPMRACARAPTSPARVAHALFRRQISRSCGRARPIQRSSRIPSFRWPLHKVCA